MFRCLSAVSRRFCAASSLVVFVLVAGCSGRADLAEVRGTVRLDGQSLADAFVVFAPTQSGTTAYGRTGPDGTYRMMFKDNEPGAWIGENVVKINTGDVGAGGGSGKKERVPVVYNQRSTLRATVNAGTNVFDFDLKSDAGKVVQIGAD